MMTMSLIRVIMNLGKLPNTKINNYLPLRSFHFSCVKKNIKPASEVNTNVIKDVILYKYENPKFFKMMNVFAIVQFGFWSYLSFTAYETLRDVPAEKNADVWWKRINLGENKYRNAITFSCFLIGYGILTISWMYTLKSVRFLILHKGGLKSTIVTYTPFGQNRMFSLDLQNISCVGTRHNNTSYVPFKVKGHLLHYLLDMKGEFRNPQLFDHTVGLRRNISI